MYFSVYRRLVSRKVIQLEELNRKIYEKKSAKSQARELRILFLGYEQNSFFEIMRTVLDEWTFCYELFPFSKENKYAKKADELAFQTCIHEFVPDIIVGEDIRKSDLPFYIHESIFFLTWLDSNYLFTYTDEAEKYVQCIDERNLFLLPYMTPENDYELQFVNSDWYQKHIVKMPFVCDGNVFKKYELTEVEKQKYQADICVVTNNSGYEIMDEIVFYWYGLNNIKSTSIYMKIVEAYNAVKAAFYEETRRREAYIAERTWWKETSIRIFKECDLFTEDIVEEDIEVLWRSMGYQASELAWREATVDYLIEAGYRVKLWGGYWNKPLYQKNNMGRINDPVELSKMYNATKINLCTLPLFGIHRRTFEGILSDCFPLLSGTGQHDWSDIGIFFERGTNVEEYSNKTELLDKVSFYLENEKERIQMLERQQQIIADSNLNSDDVMKKALKEVFNRIDMLRGYAI